MSKEVHNTELPPLSADESGHSSGSITDDSAHIKQQESSSLIDQFIYNLEQIAQNSSLMYTQQQQQQQQQQMDNQFLKQSVKADTSFDNASHLSDSLSVNMDSLDQTVAPGEQQASIWSGLNNFISNVTHNNLFPTIPNIARSFTEYLSSHPVPFLSSLNSGQGNSALSPSSIPSSYFSSALQQNQSGKGLQIRVLGVPQTGAKSRVETQIKLCLQLVTDAGEKAQWWSHLRLPEQKVTKDKSKKIRLRDRHLQLPVSPDKVLFLQARVLCASDPSKKVTTCVGCIQRERKRIQRRKDNRMQSENDEKIEEDQATVTANEEEILLFNCPEIVDFSAGDTILPTRITCYCRHHNEKIGFCIYFQLLDHTGKNIAEGISPPIMITDDHKSKSGTKRRRIDSEVAPESRLLSLNWMKSLPFTSDFTSPSSSSSQAASQSSAPASASYPTFPSSISGIFSSPMISNIKCEEKFTNSMLQQQQPSPTPPIMKRLIPNEAPTSGGIEVTILGTNFRPGLTVMFGNVPATNIQYWSPNTLICTLPPAKQAGAVVVSFKESPATTKNDLLIFTYLAESDRALMELALQVIGMKMTGVVEDARKIAMRIVQGNSSGNNSMLNPNEVIDRENDKQNKHESPSNKLS
ncbi:hypothetical protein BCV72DRAFT_304844 [Rhizopus microsporus var. microsporus]|uniref:IPT/TIG domain-containing protein n=2 Tax=Rhizopus microsporus TaxID=58291 RepID=A0A2G4SMI5_RHIZD|nr:uncharacterized protein RHIMIDRAFT_240067 [Rhizopus microsporus ATCC 52813]ORE07219.1 hypothetical protein BCV72DRAFT_304844 [Rhizopus microsporus var. microsporus]PHZ09952.1 hypothetical protein RHIMIDRAFT_240067 [Rhizopus microsporus ATCC 52813]